MQNMKYVGSFACLGGNVNDFSVSHVCAN